MNMFYKETKSKKKDFFIIIIFLLGGGGCGEKGWGGRRAELVIF